MAERLAVYIYADDPFTGAGMASHLRVRPEIYAVDDGDIDQAAVALVVVDVVGDEAVRVIRAIQRNGCPRVVVVARCLDDAAILAAAEAGACGLLRRSEAAPQALVEAILGAAHGDGTLPPDLLGRLLAQVGRLQRDVLVPTGMTFGGLREREVDVLRLVADGHDTAEIAAMLSYSERTVKNVIHDVTVRLQLRNRSHAVAYALRQGLI